AAGAAPGGGGRRARAQPGQARRGRRGGLLAGDREGRRPGEGAGYLVPGAAGEREERECALGDGGRGGVLVGHRTLAGGAGAPVPGGGDAGEGAAAGVADVAGVRGSAGQAGGAGGRARGRAAAGW